MECVGISAGFPKRTPRYACPECSLIERGLQERLRTFMTALDDGRWITRRDKIREGLESSCSDSGQPCVRLRLTVTVGTLLLVVIYELLICFVH